MLRLSVLFLLLVCCAANVYAANDPAGDVFGGLAINHTATDNSSISFTGWHASAAINVHKAIGIVGDFAGLYKKDEDGQMQYLFGPRFSGNKNGLIYFGEALYGGDRIAGESFFAMAYGGGVEVTAGKFRIRLLQIDWIPLRRGNDEPWLKNNVRYSFGLDIPFGMRK
ncbi:MAG TPA: hypothetical protein VFO86_09705 [Terriglobia bacterium]|nr:hypothetical protein [Terriglobia bacterium]